MTYSSRQNLYGVVRFQKSYLLLRGCNCYTRLAIQRLLPASLTALYTDDLKCSRIIDTAGEQDLFQKDLGNLPQWSVLNSMDCNVKSANYENN